MPRLTITAADHVDCPGPEGGDPEAQLWNSRDASGCVYGCTVGGLCWMCWPGRVSFRFRPLADEVLAVAQSSLQTDFIHDTYRRQALPMILQVRGHEVLHASAVAMPQGVVALCGESGVGKSTLAYGLHRRGYRLCADDAIGFQTSRLHPKPPAGSPGQVGSESKKRGAAHTSVDTAPACDVCALRRED